MKTGPRFATALILMTAGVRMALTVSGPEPAAAAEAANVSTPPAPSPKQPAELEIPREEGAAMAPAVTPPKSDASTTAAPNAASNPPSLTARPLTARPFRFSLGVADIVRLYDQQVGTEVILAYIANSGVPYYLSADEIIELQRRGVPAGLITAMIREGAQVQNRNMAAQRAAPAPPPVSTAPVMVTPGQVPATQTEPAVTYVEPEYVPSPYPVYVNPYYSYSYPYTYSYSYWPSVGLSFYGSFGHYRPYYAYQGHYPPRRYYPGAFYHGGGYYGHPGFGRPGFGRPGFGHSFPGPGRGGWGGAIHGGSRPGGFNRVSFGGRGSWTAIGGRRH